MVKKKFDLSKDMIITSKETNQTTSKSTNKEAEDLYETITLRIKKSIKKEFKLWCVENNIQMNDAFVQAWMKFKTNK
ncbi:hypothetical protein SZ25_00455 [Candidatus Arcanobacter lacustris]|uniref:ParG n=1 Tax=Candidatus Arcanibacter lacustris TaxID=1607817 RepID=A0A0F5MNU5_9RICK|nr:hypothetical protein SZ25_00455 [Candidatus Arcanobacter lacustris]